MYILAAKFTKYSPCLLRAKNFHTVGCTQSWKLYFNIFYIRRNRLETFEQKEKKKKERNTTREMCVFVKETSSEIFHLVEE